MKLTAEVIERGYNGSCDVAIGLSKKEKHMTPECSLFKTKALACMALLLKAMATELFGDDEAKARGWIFAGATAACDLFNDIDGKIIHISRTPETEGEE